MGLRAARETSGKTQKQVAESIGVSEQQYQQYEYGERYPGVRTAIRIAEAVDIEVPDNFKKLWQNPPDGNPADE